MSDTTAKIDGDTVTATYGEITVTATGFTGLAGDHEVKDIGQALIVAARLAQIAANVPGGTCFLGPNFIKLTENLTSQMLGLALLEAFSDLLDSDPFNDFDGLRAAAGDTGKTRYHHL